MTPTPEQVERAVVALNYHSHCAHMSPNDRCAACSRLHRVAEALAAERVLALEEACKLMCVGCAQGFGVESIGKWPWMTGIWAHENEWGYCTASAIRAALEKRT